MRAKKRTTPLIDDYHLLSYEVLDSTNAEARRLAEGGGEHGAFVWALSQTDGRGRRGREWVSQDGNLFVSMLLEPGAAMPQISQLSFVAAVAAAESISPFFENPGAVTCKWPNDILLNGKKLAGILLESFETREEDRVRRWVVIGLGMNIDNFPDDVEAPATSLTDAGVEIISAKIVLSRFIHHFIDRYGEWQNKGFPPIRKRWLEQCAGLGKRIKVQLPNETLSGTFAALDGHGYLELQMKNGETRKIAAGDVFFV